MAFVPKKEILKTSVSKVATATIFDASSKTIVVDDQDFQEILFAINVTDGIVVFDPATPAKTGTRKGRKINLTFDTSAMNDSDDILVIYEPTESPKEAEVLLENILEAIQEIKIQMSLITGFDTEGNQ